MRNITEYFNYNNQCLVWQWLCDKCSVYILYMIYFGSGGSCSGPPGVPPGSHLVPGKLQLIMIVCHQWYKTEAD